jgi:CheY-like chemotaxis protein
MSQPLPGADPSLAGLRVLVVEDEVAISLLLEDMLLELGCEVVGPVGRLATALETAAQEEFDVAVLDVNLAGQPIYPLAEALAAKGKPFVFSTGYGAAGIDEPYRGRPVLQKPFTQHELQRVLRTVRG